LDRESDSRDQRRQEEAPKACRIWTKNRRAGNILACGICLIQRAGQKSANQEPEDDVWFLQPILRIPINKQSPAFFFKKGRLTILRLVSNVLCCT